MTDYNRRAILGSLASLSTVAVAGCSSDSTASTEDRSSEGDNGSVLQNIHFDSMDLIVELQSTDGFDTVTVFDPDGEEETSTDVATGAERVSLGLRGYSPGEHRIVAVDSEAEEVVDETTKEIRPDLSINIEIPPKEEVDSQHPLTAPTVEITNNGSGPTSVDWIAYEDSEDILSIAYSIDEIQARNPSIELRDQEFPIDVSAGDAISVEYNAGGKVFGAPLPAEDVTTQLTVTMGTMHGPTKFERRLEYTIADSRDEARPGDSTIAVSRIDSE